jgi:hypothetical protein
MVSQTTEFSKTEACPRRTKIILVGGQKSPVGKSIVAGVLVEQMIEAKHPFYLIDANICNPSVGLTYEPEIYTHFLDIAGLDAEKVAVMERITFDGHPDTYFAADRIFDIAQTQDVVVVLPSEAISHVNRWLTENDVVGLLAEPKNTIDVIFYFVINGTPQSIESFIESVESFEGKIPHVLVKNLGAPTNIRWDRGFDVNGKAQAILDKYGFDSIEFPEMPLQREDRGKITIEHIPFGAAIDSDWMLSSTKEKLNKWLKEATQALGSTGIIPYHPNYIPSSDIPVKAATRFSFMKGYTD